MSQQTLANRINLPASDAEPVRVSRCDAILNTRLVDGNITISNLSVGEVGISGDVTVDQIKSTVLISGNVNVVNPVTISGTIEAADRVAISGPVEISGTPDVNVVNPVEISGGITIENPVDVSGTVSVDGAVEISGGVTVDGVVEISGVPMVELSGDVTVDGAVEISGGVSVENTVTTQARVVDRDAFGRLRVANPYTLFEFTSLQAPILENDLTFTGDFSGDGTIINENSVNKLTVSGTGDYVILQSREYIMYQPGKSRLTYLTGVLVPSEGFNGTTYIGSFDASSGYAFGYDTGGVFIIERDNGIDRKVYQTSLDASAAVWNIEDLSDLDFTKAQIFAMDQEWLGVGQVRLGCVVEGDFRPCHIFTHKNELVQPYFATAKLPIRYEIQSDGSSGEVGVICGTVISEGGFNSLGNVYGATQAVGPLTLGTGVSTPIMSIRLREEFPHINTTIKVNQIDIINTNNNRSVFWELRFNPETTLSDGVFENYVYPKSSARVCYHGDGDTISGGITIVSGFVSADGSIQLIMTRDELVSFQGVGRSVDGTSDQLTLCARSLTGSPDIYGLFNWIEIR